ncbi:hypothetical protein SAMN04488563_4610 [Jiangella alkaliphila]|uniref:Uncharacterized protein n=1 Tax=Jiangella alkaliphila TaxID=419479 RepID=A0A1H2KYE0_9ACTN|nr:hypothetical protein SAMN04488563_4610 [Jiangella alkaliphila]
MHVSKAQPRAASAHGYWKQVAGTCPSTANVDIFLQARFCTPAGCGWRTVASGSLNVRPGTGHGFRATAREACSSSATVGYRSFVDVDLPGIADPPGDTFSPAMNLPCYPSS